MIKNLFPNKILSLNSNLISNLSIIMLIIFVLGLVYSLYISPPDYIQGESVRIMYVHVPSSFISLGCFGIIGLAIIVVLASILQAGFLGIVDKILERKQNVK